MSYLTRHTSEQVPQSEPLTRDQVENSAGGFAWAVDEWTRLRRFLILGTEGGSYYAGERDLTRENFDAIRACLAADGKRTVAEIVEVSQAGRAPKNDPAILALALAAGEGDTPTRRLALDALPLVCRTGTHLFQFATFAQAFRGWGRQLRRAVGAWYAEKDPAALAYQAVKYRQRGGWTHRDLLRLAHPDAPSREHVALYQWIVGRETDLSALPKIVDGFEALQASTSAKWTATLLGSNPDLPREAVQPEHLTSLEVWDALLANMPMTAMIRNLATMTRVGLLLPGSNGTKRVIDQLGDVERLRKARVHPIQVLAALTTYASGQGARGNKLWTPVAQVVDALDEAFYSAFGNVEPTGKRWLLALDISGSMEWGSIAGVPGLTPRAASAAMALVTAATEPAYEVMAFATSFTPVPLSPRQRLDDVVRRTSALPMGGTDCSLPMLYAMQHDREIDTFVVYTDSETWAGSVHPAKALRDYRQKSGIAARLIVCGMMANEFTIADPNDPGMLDVVGFDTATPQVMADFALGAL